MSLTSILFWYVTDYTDMKTSALEYVSNPNLERLRDAINDPLVEAATLLQNDPQLINNSITRLLR